jgi:hypothetical protein
MGSFDGSKNGHDQRSALMLVVFAGNDLNAHNPVVSGAIHYFLRRGTTFGERCEVHEEVVFNAPGYVPLNICVAKGHFNSAGTRSDPSHSDEYVCKKSRNSLS